MCLLPPTPSHPTDVNILPTGTFIVTIRTHGGSIVSVGGNGSMQKGNLKTNYPRSTGEKPFKRSQQGCGKSFCQMAHLKHHELTHTGESRSNALTKDVEKASIMLVIRWNIRKQRPTFMRNWTTSFPLKMPLLLVLAASNRESKNCLSSGRACQGWVMSAITARDEMRCDEGRRGRWDAMRCDEGMRGRGCQGWGGR